MGGPIRHSKNINQRVQDGLKFAWLCSACEGRFNRWETQFANNVFHPLTGDEDTVRYGDWLLKFCTSVSWRVLLHSREQNLLKHFSSDHLTHADQALEVWANFLLGKRPHPSGFEQHILPLGAIETASHMRLPPNINRYFLRGIQIDVACNRSTSIVFSKLGSIAIIGFINVPNAKDWTGTKVRVRGGTIKPRTYVIPAQFGHYLLEKAEGAWDDMARMSSAQRRKVDDHVRANLDQFANSDVFKAMQFDVDMFGHRAFHDREGK
jgi:hypothetical protein